MLLPAYPFNESDRDKNALYMKLGRVNKTPASESKAGTYDGNVRELICRPQIEFAVSL